MNSIHDDPKCGRLLRARTEEIIKLKLADHRVKILIIVYKETI